MLQSYFNTKSIIREVAIVLSTLVIISIIPLIVISVPLCLILKLTVLIIAKLLRRDLQSFVAGSSVIFALDDPTQSPKINLITLLILEGNLELEVLRSQIQDRIIERLKPNGTDLVYPELQQYWTSYLNYFFWKKDDKFDLRNHVRFYDYTEEELQLSTNATTTTNDDESENYCNEVDLHRVIPALLAQPWPKERSPWELLLVPNFYDSNSSSKKLRKPQTVIIFRLHHGMGDGYSYVKLMQYLTQVPEHKLNLPKLNQWEQILHTLSLPLKLPYDFARSFLDSFDGPNCWHLFGKELSRKYHCSFTRAIPTDFIKKIKNKYNVSYNDVLCTAICGALRKTMKIAGQKIPSNISCLFPFPLPNHPGGIANHMTLAFAKWPIGLEATPVQRLHKMSKGMKKSKYFAGPLALHILKNKLGSIYPNFLSRGIHHMSFSTLGVSCFPGPEDAPIFFGIKVQSVIAGVGLGHSQMGATIVLFSSGGQQRFLATIDQTVFPSRKLFQTFSYFIEEELDALWKDEEIDAIVKRK